MSNSTVAEMLSLASQMAEERGPKIQELERKLRNTNRELRILRKILQAGTIEPKDLTGAIGRIAQLNRSLAALFEECAHLSMENFK